MSGKEEVVLFSLGCSRGRGMNFLSKRRRSLAVGAVALLAIIVWLVGFRVREKGWHDDELWKLAVQFFVATILGGLIGYVYRGFEHNRDVRLANVKLLEDFYGRFVEAYNGAKYVRRQFRPLLTDTAGSSQCSNGQAYEALIEKLQWTQLKIEALARDVKLRASLFGEATPLEDLETMESFLNHILSDHQKGYEGLKAPRSSTASQFRVGQKLHDFTQSRKKTSPEVFFRAADRVQEAVIARIEQLRRG